MKKIHIGTSGYNYKSWKGDFYPKELPQNKWLEFYSEKFSIVEINNSFYVTVRKETYKNWHKRTPKDFSFVIKGHRYITQFKKLKNVKDPVDLFFENANALDEKLKVVLWQFPSNFVYKKDSHDRLKNFLQLLPTKIKHAFEFREKGWFNKDVLDLFEKNNSTLVISDSKSFPSIEMPGNKFVYIRLHGPEELYSSGYSDKQLSKWSRKIRDYSKDREVFVFFNNDNGGYAFRNAQNLKELI